MIETAGAPGTAPASAPSCRRTSSALSDGPKRDTATARPILIVTYYVPYRIFARNRLHERSLLDSFCVIRFQFTNN